MKKLLTLLLAAVMLLSLAACQPSDNNNGSSPATTAPGNNNSEPIALTVWGAEEDQALLIQLVDEFKKAYSDYTFDIQIGVESESTAKDTVLTDIEAAADVFAFASDQLNDLVAAGALLNLSGDVSAVLPAYAGKSLEDVMSANGEGSVNAASKDGKLYAFPMGGGNNYFLYYDSSKISAESAQSWDTLLAAAEAAGGKVGMTFASGWYNASFFLGAGFTASMNEDGTTYINWNSTSPSGFSGVDVTKSMISIASHPAFLAIPDGQISGEINSGNVCAVVSGTWDAGACQGAYGDGYAACKLPTFTCAGQQVQMSCYSGFKLMGVNAYSKNTGWAVLLAEFLTNESSQAARFDARQLAPTNLKAAANDAVNANIAIAASAAQDVYGSVQNVGGKYWDPTATFGQMIANGGLSIDDDAAIQSALDIMVDGVCAPLG